MKYIVVVGDGMADYPLEELSGRTPLEVANTPEMDFIAENGRSGLLKTMVEGMPLGSDIANLSILGYSPKLYYPGGRGSLEALSIGISLEEKDIAFRCNLIAENNGLIEDYSAGQISTREARELIKELDKELGSEKIEFHSGVGYRHILLLKGIKGENLKCIPPHDIMGQKVEENLPSAQNEEGKEIAEILRNLIWNSRKILQEHPVNRDRIKDGKLPANMIWPWGPGKKPEMPKFREKYGMQGSLISAVDLLKGIGICLDLEVVDVPGATGYLDTNYEGKADAAIKSLSKRDFVYLHVEAPDEASHEGSTEKKIQAIENLDRRVVGRLLNSIQQEFVIGILPDHLTPISLRVHTSEPVPFAIYSPERNPDGVKKFSENDAKNGYYSLREGAEFMKLLLKDV